MLNLRLALAPYGAHIKVIRRRIFISALRVAEYITTTQIRSHEMWDPSGLAMHAKLLSRKRSVEELELTALLKAHQACALYFDDFNWRPESIDTLKVGAAIRILERTGKTPIIGARFQRKVVTAENVKRFRTIEGIDRIRGELVAVLGGAAQTLSGILSGPSGGLAFTLEGRQKAMEEDQRDIPRSS
jgi:ribosomal protein L10